MKMINLKKLNRYKYYISFLVILSLSFPGCASIAKKMFKKPTVAYEGFQLKHIDFAGTSLVFFLSVDNPNRVGLKIAKMQHALYLDGEKFLETEMDDAIYIKPNKRTVLEIPIQFTFSGFKKGLTYLLKTRLLPYELKSLITLDTPIGDIPVKIEKRGELELPPPPKIAVKKVKLRKMSFTDIDIVFYVVVKNNDEVNLKIANFSYSLDLNNSPISKGVVTTITKDNISKELHLEIPISLKILNLKRSIIKTIKSGKIDYELNMYLNMKSRYGAYIIPVEKRGTSKMY